MQSALSPVLVLALITSSFPVSAEEKPAPPETSAVARLETPHADGPLARAIAQETARFRVSFELPLSIGVGHIEDASVPPNTVAADAAASRSRRLSKGAKIGIAVAAVAAAIGIAVFLRTYYCNEQAC